MALKKQWMINKDKHESKPKGLVARNALIDMKKKYRYPQKNLQDHKKVSKSEIKTLDHNQSLKLPIEQVISYDKNNTIALPPLKSAILSPK